MRASGTAHKGEPMCERRDEGREKRKMGRGWAGGEGREEAGERKATAG